MLNCVERAAAVQKAGSTVFIQCVGSREPERPYCSRVCCTHTVHNAIKLKELNPEMNVYVLYRDMRTYGLREELYTRARELGVIFIKFYPDGKPKVFKDGDALKVEIVDPILQMPVRLTADYLVLAAGIVPNETQDLVELFKASINADGFFNEAHPKLRPVDSMVDGLFIAGLCHHPKPLDEAISQAKAAVSRAGAHPGQRRDATGRHQVPGDGEVRRLRPLPGRLPLQGLERWRNTEITARPTGASPRIRRCARVAACAKPPAPRRGWPFTTSPWIS